MASIYSLICMFISIHDFVLPLYKIYICIIFVCCYSTVNIPMIVCLSSKNNIANIATKRQMNNTLAWNRTRNQQWEIKCAIKDRIQNTMWIKHTIKLQSLESCQRFVVQTHDTSSIYYIARDYLYLMFFLIKSR